MITIIYLKFLLVSISFLSIFFFNNFFLRFFYSWFIHSKSYPLLLDDLFSENGIRMSKNVCVKYEMFIYVFYFAKIIFLFSLLSFIKLSFYCGNLIFFNKIKEIVLIDFIVLIKKI